MGFSTRMKQMLLVLLKEEAPVSVKYLADQVGVSKRTMQRELGYIESDLRNHPIQFKSKTGVGIWLEGEKEDRDHLLQELEGEDRFDVMNKEERRKRLILEILKEKGLKKLFCYSSTFQVSEATISNDLEAIEPWLNSQNLRILRKPGSGVVIEGSEEAYRGAIRKFIDENMNADFIRESYESHNSDARSGIEKLKNSEIGQILKDEILQIVVETIGNLGDERVLNLTEHSYIGLVLHISIAINRILKEEIIEQNDALIAEVSKDEDFTLAAQIVSALEQAFQIQIPEMEIYYICLHIKGSKHQKIQLQDQTQSGAKKQELQKLINEMIDAYDGQIAYLLKQDDEFIQGLLAHLQPTLIRILYHMQIQNPILEEIKTSYGAVYEKCEHVAEVLEKWTGQPVPDTETGFLTVHFGAALVRLEDRKESFRQVSVGIICASGIGISRLMASKIERNFKNRVVIHTYGKGDITPYILSNTDFFVSSIMMDDTQGDILFVNALLGDEDMEQIQKKVRHYEQTPAKKQEESPGMRQLEGTNLVAHQIHLIVDHMQCISMDEEVPFPSMVAQIADALAPYEDQSTHIVTDIMNREKLGTQIFAEFGFALLHTRTKGVTRPEFAVIHPETGDHFSDPYFKEIQVVILMLIPIDNHLKENSDILGFISSTIIEDDHFLNTLITADKETIKEELHIVLKRYFTHYINRL